MKRKILYSLVISYEQGGMDVYNFISDKSYGQDEAIKLMRVSFDNNTATAELIWTFLDDVLDETSDI